MTVEEAITKLSKIKNKKMVLYLDCPNCGKANTMAEVKEVILAKTKS